MADEPKQEQVEQTETETKEYDWREEPGAKAMRKQIADLQRQVESAAQASKEAAEKRERKKLEDREQYDTIVRELEEKMAAQATDFEARMTAKDLDIELTRNGFTNPLLLQGAKAGYDGSVPIADYVAALVADESVQALLSPAEATRNPDPKFSKPSSKSATKTLDERLADGDPDAQMQKLAELTGLNLRRS